MERLRDLMLITSLGEGARAILRGLGPEQFDLLAVQANRFGLPQLTSAAEATSKALADTSGSANPRLQLELLCARVLAPAIEITHPAPAAPKLAAVAPKVEPVERPAAPVRVEEKKPEPAKPEAAAPAAPKPAATTVTVATFKNGWQDILDSLAKQSRSAWAVAFTTKVLDYQDEVLTLLFQSQKDVDAFKNSQGAAEVLRQVILETYGVRVKYKAKVAEAPSVAPKAPVIEPSEPDEFVSEEEREEEVTEVIQTLPAVETEKSGEFMLREMLGAQPLKDEQ